jgi:hypothetical protein
VVVGRPELVGDQDAARVAAVVVVRDNRVGHPHQVDPLTAVAGHPADGLTLWVAATRRRRNSAEIVTNDAVVLDRDVADRP